MLFRVHSPTLAQKLHSSCVFVQCIDVTARENAHLIQQHYFSLPPVFVSPSQLLHACAQLASIHMLFRVHSPTLAQKLHSSCVFVHENVLAAVEISFAEDFSFSSSAGAVELSAVDVSPLVAVPFADFCVPGALAD